jgi:hypothetical protein
MKSHADKGIEHPFYERLVAENESESITLSTQATVKAADSPKKRYAQLEMWLKIANGEDIGPYLDVGDKKKIELSPFVRDPMTRSVKQWFERLCVIAEALRADTGRLQRYRNAGSPDGGSIHLPPWEALDSEFWGEFQLDLSGHLRDNPWSIRQALRQALIGAEIDRFAYCPVCKKVFYAIRSDQKACGRTCANALRVRAWRANKDRYKYSRYLKDERKTRQQKSRKEPRK